MMTPTINSTAFTSPLAYVVPFEQAGGIESFSREAPDPSWQQWTDWLRDLYPNPSVVEDDLLTPPTRAVIDTALGLLSTLKTYDPMNPPTSVGLEPNGGIVLEYRQPEKDDAAVFTIYDDLRIDEDRYRNGRLMESQTLQASQLH